MKDSVLKALSGFFVLLRSFFDYVKPTHFRIMKAQQSIEFSKYHRLKYKIQIGNLEQQSEKYRNYGMFWQVFDRFDVEVQEIVNYCLSQVIQ